MFWFLGCKEFDVLGVEGGRWGTIGALTIRIA